MIDKTSVFRKFIRRFFFIFSPLFVFCIISISFFKIIRIGMLSSERIGELVSRLEIYLSERKLKIINNDVLDLFFFNDKISNKTYADLISKKINIISNLFLFPIYKLILILSYKFKFFNKFLIETKSEDNNFSILQTKNNVVLSSDFLKKGEEFLEKLKIKENDKIVCLIVREKAYLEKVDNNSNHDYHDYRNCKFDNFIPMINKLTELGYYVFRMGAVVEKKYDLNNSKFIDYANLYRTDYLDIFLAHRCSFCITTGTGWDLVPGLVFRKPMIWTILVPPGNFATYSDKFLFTTKIHRDKKNNSFLSLKEISDRGLAYSFTQKKYDDKNVELIENTPEDLIKLVDEIIELINNKDNFEIKENDMIKKFWKRYNEVFYIDNLSEFSEKKENLEKLRLQCTSQRIFKGKNMSYFSPSFLKKNLFLIK